jgi:hypothetical protein
MSLSKSLLRTTPRAREKPPALWPVAAVCDRRPLAPSPHRKARREEMIKHICEVYGIMPPEADPLA